MTNAQMVQQASAQNAQLGSQEAQINNQNANMANQYRNAYLAQAMSVPGQTMRDISALRQQDAMVNMSGNDFRVMQYQDPNANWLQRTFRSPEAQRVFIDPATGLPSYSKQTGRIG
jgi:hypothetical protein